MNYRIANYIEGIVVISISGRKIERFLSYLYKLKISILHTKYIDRQHIKIKILKHDLDKVMNLKTTYDVEIVGYEGKLGLINSFKKNVILVASIIIGYLLLLLLSNMIFEVEVIHSNASIRNLIVEELANRNIKKWNFKKNYEGIEQIKKEILLAYKDRIEWLEIQNIGTKYIVRVEERKIRNAETNYTYQDIIATKNAVIMKIEASAGEIVKRKNDYVKKGDLLISGKIMKGEEITKLIKASGKIYGEVWYNIKVEHPLIYQSKIRTGQKRNVYKIMFLDNGLSLFDFHPFKNAISNYHSIVSNPLIPFKIVKDTQHEVVVEDEVYTDSEALIKAEQLAIAKMEDYLLEDEYIIGKRKLKYYIENDKIYLEMFFKVYENIGEAREILE